MRIGIIVASESERKPFIEVFGEPSAERLEANGTKVLIWNLQPNREVYLLHSGVGEIAAAIGTQYLIDKFGVDRIINYGMAGGLSEEHLSKKIGVVDKVIHYDFDLSSIDGYVVGRYPGEKSRYLVPSQDAIPASLTSGLLKFTCASADKFVPAGESKRRLRKEFDADICEMEAAGVIIACNKNNIPCTFIKAISDGVDEDSEAYENNVHSTSRDCIALIKKYINQI